MIEYELFLKNRRIRYILDDVLPRKGDTYIILEEGQTSDHPVRSDFCVTDVKHILKIDSNKKSVAHRVHLSPLEK